MIAISPRRDIPAGLAVAGLLLPEAIAYAGIAGLPTIHALIAAGAGLIIYGFLGRSRFAIVAPTSSSAAVLAAGLATLGISGDGRVVVAGMVVAITGTLFVAAGLLRLGSIASFVSRPVLRGFAVGLAISIVIRQLPAITGVAAHAPSAPLLFVALLEAIAHWNWLSIALGVTALALLLFLRRWPAVPGAFTVLSAGIALSCMMDLTAAHISLVGPLALAMPHLALPSFDTLQWMQLANVALPLALILFVESWGTIRTLALGAGDNAEPNRELLALGVANLVSGTLGGIAAGAGFSASSANEAAGAQSRMAGLVAAIALVMLAGVATPLIARTPEPVLAAIVIAALSHALDPKPVLYLWKIDRDQFVALTAAVGVLVFGVLNGMVFAVALSILALIRRIATPEVAVLGQFGASHNYVDIARHADAHTRTNILIARPGEPMFFANAERILTDVEGRAEAQGAWIVILSLEESTDLDSTALAALGESAMRLTARGRQLMLTRVKDPVCDLLAVAGGALSPLAETATRSVADAVNALAHASKETAP